MRLLDLLFHLTVAGLLHDIKLLFCLLKPTLGFLHVLENMLGALFQLAGRGYLGRHEVFLVWILLNGLDKLVQIHWGPVKVLGHIFQVELRLLNVERL